MVDISSSLVAAGSVFSWLGPFSTSSQCRWGAVFPSRDHGRCLGHYPSVPVLPPVRSDQTVVKTCRCAPSSRPAASPPSPLAWVWSVIYADFQDKRRASVSRMCARRSTAVVASGVRLHKVLRDSFTAAFTAAARKSGGGSGAEDSVRIVRRTR